MHTCVRLCLTGAVPEGHTQRAEHNECTRFASLQGCWPHHGSACLFVLPGARARVPQTMSWVGHQADRKHVADNSKLSKNLNGCG